MTFLSQKDYGYLGVNSNDFLLKFRGFKEGLWKQKKLGELIQILSEFDSIGVEKVQRKTLFKSKNEKIKSTNTSGKLINNVIFIFTPLNYFTDDKPQNIIENVVGNLIMKFFGNIRVHKYYCFQKRLGILGLTNNLLPISEMLLIRPELLDEKNFELFLNILKTIINSRKHNMKYLLENPFLRILSLFFEKYPKNIFTEKILDAIIDIWKCLISGNIETATSLYFEHILLNEKILLKYS